MREDFRTQLEEATRRFLEGLEKTIEKNPDEFSLEELKEIAIIMNYLKSRYFSGNKLFWQEITRDWEGLIYKVFLSR